MALNNVSDNYGLDTLELFDTKVVNIEQTDHVEMVIILVILIPVVNIPIIYSIQTDKSRTFINKLIMLDCVNALGHVPILLQFLQ